MNEQPIINPWIFYWISTLDKLDKMFIILSVLVGIVLVVFIVSGEGLKGKKAKRITISLLVVFICSLLLSMFMPTKETMYSMLVAKTITYEKVSKAVSIGKDVKETIKQDILDIIKEINKKDDKEKRKVKDEK